MNIKIITDSTCDLPEDLIQKYNIRVVPLSIMMGDQFYKDGVEIKPKDIFEFVDSGKGLCKTSAVNVGEYLQVYEEERPNCDAIIHFTISADMSSCYQNARIATQEFDNIYLIDSRNLSAGIGHLVLDAAQMAAQGTPAEEICHEIGRRIPLLDTSFIIDTLTYLHKGGRCSAVAALVSNVLKIKPSIIVSEGKMTVGKKYRGNLESVVRKHLDDKMTTVGNIDTRRAIVTYTTTPQNRHIVDMVKSLLKDEYAFDEVLEAEAGGTISCHCGPNAVGLKFIRTRGA